MLTAAPRTVEPLLSYEGVRLLSTLLDGLPCAPGSAFADVGTAAVLAPSQRLAAGA